MKYLSIILSTCSLLFAFNTTNAQRLASNENNTKNKPKFIEGVVIENNNSTTGNIESSTSNRRTNNRNANNVGAEDANETAESKTTAERDIIKGMETNKTLYSFIDDWYGVKYVFGGTTRKGIDCSAFCRELYKNVYGKQLDRTSREQFADAKFLGSKSQLKEGDLVFFKIRTRDISHVGVYLSDGKFVHASRSKGIVISSLEDSYWSRYYVGGGRVK